MNLVNAALLTLSALVSVVVALIAWRRRAATGAVGLMLYMLAMVIWAGTYAINWSVPDIKWQYFWLDMTYVGVELVPVVTVIFVLQFTHRSQLLTRRNILLLCIVPVLTLLILATDNLHGWFYNGMRQSHSIPFGGPWFWINIYYIYAVYAIMVILVIWDFVGASRLYRLQIGAVLVGMLLPFIGSFVTLSGKSPFGDLDIIPFSFTASGLVIAYGIFRYQLLDLVPVAHSSLIHSLPDGVMVLDDHRRIVEINPAGRAMLGCSEDAIGKKVDKILPDTGMDFFKENNVETSAEMSLPGGSGRVIDVRSIPLLDRSRSRGGTLFIIHDITERKLMENKLKEMSIHDALTGLFNRSFFEEELMRLEYNRVYPVSLVMADVDNLKVVNDEQGHAAGDKILQRTAQVLRSAFRTEDVITRIGGDEFVVILTNADAAVASRALERARKAFEDHNAEASGTPISISFGISTAMTGEPLAEAFKKADAEMYREKRLHKVEGYASDV